MREPAHQIEVARWRRALAPLVQQPDSIVDRIVVLDETPSTQDECRRLTDRPGLLVTALRQTAGRGRLGRQWADDRGEGVALTIAVAPQPPERLSVASAIAACEAAERFVGRRLSIRWPNDIMASGRKLAGILIEQHGPLALIGIGVNVNQPAWPESLEEIAISLRELLDSPQDRITVIHRIVSQLGDALGRDDDRLTAAFQDRDLLAGTTQHFTIGRERITGTVVRIDPLRGLLVRTVHGQRFLPAATTSLAR